jgi:hypothetical protein
MATNPGVWICCIDSGGLLLSLFSLLREVRMEGVLGSERYKVFVTQGKRGEERRGGAVVGEGEVRREMGVVEVGEGRMDGWG